MIRCKGDDSPYTLLENLDMSIENYKDLDSDLFAETFARWLEVAKRMAKRRNLVSDEVRGKTLREEYEEELEDYIEKTNFYKAWPKMFVIHLAISKAFELAIEFLDDHVKYFGDEIK